MDLQPRSSGFSVAFGITSPAPVPDMYQVVAKKVDYRQDFEEGGKKSSRKLGQLHRDELIEGLPGADCKRTDSKGIVWVLFAKPDFGRDGVGWAPVTEKKKRVLELQPPPKVYGELGGDKSEFVVEVHPTWAPLATQRFRELCEAQFFVGCRFFRVVPGFVAQWGINGTPGATEEWTALPDEPREQCNLAGTLAFANSGPGTRSTQLFVNYNDAKSLDERDFVPFAEVAEGGMEALENVFAGYGEEPDQERIRGEGNDYLRGTFPQLSFIHSCEIIERQDGGGSPAPEALERVWSPRVDRYTGKPYVENIHTGERRDKAPEDGEQHATAAKTPQASRGLEPPAAAAREAEGAAAAAADFGDFSAFEDDSGAAAAAAVGFEANFEDGEGPPAASGGGGGGDGGEAASGYDFGDYGGVSLEDAMGGGWSDEDDDDADQGYSGFRDGGEGGGAAAAAAPSVDVEESIPPSSAVSWSRTDAGGNDAGATPEPEPQAEAAPSAFDWSGLWSCCYAPKSTRTFDKIRMRQVGDRIIGVKAEGPSCLGSNWVLLEAFLPAGATSGRGRRLLYAKKDGKSVRDCLAAFTFQTQRTLEHTHAHCRAWLAGWLSGCRPSVTPSPFARAACLCIPPAGPGPCPAHTDPVDPTPVLVFFRRRNTGGLWVSYASRQQQEDQPPPERKAEGAARMMAPRLSSGVSCQPQLAEKRSLLTSGATTRSNVRVTAGILQSTAAPMMMQNGVWLCVITRLEQCGSGFGISSDTRLLHLHCCVRRTSYECADAVAVENPPPTPPPAAPSPPAPTPLCADAPAAALVPVSGSAGGAASPPAGSAIRSRDSTRVRQIGQVSACILWIFAQLEHMHMWRQGRQAVSLGAVMQMTHSGSLDGSMP